jgi:hypothetical protein
MSAYIVFTRDRQVREHRIKGAVYRGILVEGV